jgi:RNA polymerase sigma factor (sigma-70 family)
MLTEQQALTLYRNYIELDKTTANKFALSKAAKACVDGFKYIVLSGASKYRSFNNYEDLIQEGNIALFSSFESFNEERKGSIFYWVHHYVDTKIKRKASKHNLIDVPLQKAKKILFKTTQINYTIKQEGASPEKLCEEFQVNRRLKDSIELLPSDQKNIIESFFGLDVHVQ